MHNRFPGLEWSGVLLYTIDGSITDLDNATFHAHKFFPLDIGTPGYTEFDYNEKIMQMYDMWEDAIDMQIGLIHTHHTMKAYFSATDDDELHDNVDKHNYYLSLIVSQTSDYCAQVAALVDMKVNEVLVKNEDGDDVPIPDLSVNMPKYMALTECDVQMPEGSEDANTPYMKWINELQEASKKKKSSYTSSGYSYNGYNNPKGTYSKNTHTQGQLPLKNDHSGKVFKLDELPYHTKTSLFAKILALDINCTDSLHKVIADINKAAKQNKEMSNLEYLKSHVFAIFEYAPTIAESFLGIPISLADEGTIFYELAAVISNRKDSDGVVPVILKQMEIPDETKP